MKSPRFIKKKKVTIKPEGDIIVFIISGHLIVFSSLIAEMELRVVAL